MRCIPIGKGPRECFMCVAFDTWVKRLTQTCSVPPDIKREETNTKGSNIKSFRLWTIGHRTFYGYVLFLASICFQIQLPVSYRYLKGLSPRSSERDAVSRPRRRHQEKEPLMQNLQLWFKVLKMVYKIKSLGLLAHVSFRMHYCTSTSCLSNGSSCRDLPCLSFANPS